MATLSENITQAIEDFDSIQQSIIEKGVEVPEGTPTKEYSEKILEIETGITPSGTVELTQNEDGVDIAQYATANVRVPQPGGKILIEQNGDDIDVSSYALADVHVEQPGGKITITENGTDIDVSSYALADVEVPQPEGTLQISTPGTHDVNDYQYADVSFDDFIQGKLTTFSTDITIVPDFAFSGKSKLETVDIPEALFIGRYAFSCATDKDVVSGRTPGTTDPYEPIPENDDGDGELEEFLPFNNNSLTTVNMPKVTNIGEAAFYEDMNLELSELPPNLRILETKAFKYCPNVSITRLPENIVYMGDYCLDAQPHLDLGNLPATLEYIGGGIDRDSLTAYFESFVDPETNKLDFSNMPTLWMDVEFGRDMPNPRFSNVYQYLPTVIQIPCGVHKRVPSNIFAWSTYSWGAPSMAQFEIADGITEIGDSAFQGLTSLLTVSLPSSLIKIGKSAFSGCGKYGQTYNVNIRGDNHIRIILAHAFENSNFYSFGGFSDELEFIGYQAFYNTPIQSIILPDSLTWLGQGAFMACNNLQHITIGSGLSEIQPETFLRCNNIQSLQFNTTNLKAIRAKAFCCEFKVASIELPEGLEEIGDEAFLQSYRYRGYDIIIPSTLRYIGHDAFRGATLRKFDLTKKGSDVVELADSADAIFALGDYSGSLDYLQICLADEDARIAYESDPYWSTMSSYFVVESGE